jgi:hypothetical protein
MEFPATHLSAVLDRMHCLCMLLTMCVIRCCMQADGLPQPDLVNTLPGPQVTNSRHWM